MRLVVSVASLIGRALAWLAAGRRSLSGLVRRNLLVPFDDPFDDKLQLTSRKRLV